MDRVGADFYNAIDTMKKRLGAKPLPIALPIGSGENFRGIIDLTNMKAKIEAAKGQVVDADFAAETAKLARAQILMQAATAMLSQANASKQQTLKLINA